MGRIRVLDEGLIALIAAGEVVEGPWSVVKELMENSLDAGAGRVEVSISDGGFGEIRVVDDGSGMDGEDARLAFTRHATSKIGGPEDLDAIVTMGFRGEALAAIAAVARVTILTRAPGEGVGWKASWRDGAVALEQEGAAVGTTVTVRDLFYNVPARRKFAGQPALESRRAAEVFRRLALAQLAPAFALNRDGRLQLAAAGDASARQRIGDLLGWDLVEGLVPAEAAAGDFGLSAWLAPPPRSFVGTGNVYTIINGRPARAKSLFKAVLSAYEGRLERGRYPFVVLYLTLPAESLDVNVHPRKEEVRFDDDKGVYEFVGRVLRDALAREGTTVSAAALGPLAAAVSGGSVAERLAGGDAVTAIRASVEGYMRREGLWPGGGESGPATTPPEAVYAGVAERPTAATADRLEVLGQLDDTYIIVRRGRDLVVIDQHTAHERVIYDRLLAAGSDRAIARQELLLPVTVDLGPAAAADARACLAALNDIGFGVEEFGAQTFLVRSHPAELKVGDLEALLGQVINDFAEAGRPAAADRRREAVRRSVSCRAAIMAGKRLDPDEMSALVADLFASATPDVCPHGRPTLVNLPARELEKWFKR